MFYRKALCILTAYTLFASTAAVRFTFYENSQDCDASAPGVVTTTISGASSIFCSTIANRNTRSVRLDYVDPQYLFCRLDLWPHESTCPFQVPELLGTLTNNGTCFSAGNVPIGAYGLACAIV